MNKQNLGNLLACPIKRLFFESDSLNTSKNFQKISIIFPTFKQIDILPEFIARTLLVLDQCRYPYEIIVADDRSGDGTAAYIYHLQKEGVPVRVLDKIGHVGRGQSIIEALSKASGDVIVILSADLHYSIEALSQMLQAIEDTDLIINEQIFNTLSLSEVFGRVKRIFFKYVFGLPFDVQSNIIMFKKKVIENARFFPFVNFDLQLLLIAKKRKLDIRTIKSFHNSSQAPSSFPARIQIFIKTVNTTIQNLLTIFGRIFLPFLYPPESFEFYSSSYGNSDCQYLAPSQSARAGITKEFASLFYSVGILCCFFVWQIHDFFNVYSIKIVFEMISGAYLFLLLFKIYLIYISVRYPVEPFDPKFRFPVDADAIPKISAMIPLYKEREIIPQIVGRMKEMEYPSEKFEVCFVLEENDQDTYAALTEFELPSNFRIILVVNSLPKTKPKALNFAYPRTTGDILVIYDAEVLPERDQLKKVAHSFSRNPESHYLHVKMDHYNADFNWLARLFNAEFCFFYNFYLPAIVYLKLPLPISGHSTYFRRRVIEKINGWDAYNVAEDCDIGIRLYRHGFGSGMMIDSYTWEQATTTIPTWMHQRTRWIQGFIQTSLTQMRYPLLVKKELGSWWAFFCFLIFIPGNIIINILNVILLIIFLFWITTQSVVIQEWFSLQSLYTSNVSFIFGNYILILYNMIGLFVRKHYSSVFWAFLIPFYWVLLGLATIRSVLHLVLHPHYWDKTRHFASIQNS